MQLSEVFHKISFSLCKTSVFLKYTKPQSTITAQRFFFIQFNFGRSPLYAHFAFNSSHIFASLTIGTTLIGLRHAVLAYPIEVNITSPIFTFDVSFFGFEEFGSMIICITFGKFRYIYHGN